MDLFAVTGEVTHHVSDRRCPACVESYPESCPCGGLIHGALGEEIDVEGNPTVITRCDQCGRSDDQLDEV